ncbi:membrane protein, GtrA family [Anaerocolumna cellulosilytica]|uniref:Membrane protein, GtrA family n=1 Tax=Anaerocolumna cellulosilytica TaxID=433286 RepID=A0A6S6QUD4_9FIRM|nr:GtrA family protein [Anaerocolumna cellulosilytica]MBB5193871.1 putative flippase GtrA [Anaerocolumna cellulosilytica]BCJ94913.1 membrane protein, GtrA family [Anaerocolumna cellulosilytica]
MLSLFTEGQKKILARIINRETIVYGIAGVLTTLVNLLSYYLLWKVAGIESLTANAIAWVIAVTFAYFVNAFWVFRDKINTLKEEFIKLLKFFSARGFSLLIEEVGLYIFVDLLYFNNMLVKGSLAVVVIVVNYFFSKMFIFQGSKEKRVRGK